MAKGRCTNIEYAEMERLYNLVYTDREIAKIIGCSVLTVQNWRKIEDAAPNNTLKRWMEEQKVCS